MRLDVPVKLLKMRRTPAPLFARQPSAQRPSRLVVLPCRRWAIAAHGPSPGRAALAPRRARSTFLPAPESSLLGRSRPRASARRPSRRSMCGRACTPRTHAAARALTGTGSRLAAWSARPFKFLSHSAAAKRAQSADWHVARGRSASPRRCSWPPARAQRPRHSRSASRRRSASERANSHCAEIHARTEIET